jgi:hypothetical protein
MSERGLDLYIELAEAAPDSGRERGRTVVTAIAAETIDEDRDSLSLALLEVLQSSKL